MRISSSTKRNRGLTRLEVVLLIVFLCAIAAFVRPTLRLPVSRAQRIQCSNNLKQVGLSFRLWAGDNIDQFPMQISTNSGGTREFVDGPDMVPHFLVMSNELNTPKILFCTEDTNPRRRCATTFGDPKRESDVKFQSNSNLSYFVGVDAQLTGTQMFLVGDDHLSIRELPVSPGLLTLLTNSPVAWRKERHAHRGNICLVDGSVQQVDTRGLRQLLLQTGVATNRLAMP
jgi:prepilin-type processing-associated H-X9-DG protein